MRRSSALTVKPFFKTVRPLRMSPCIYGRTEWSLNAGGRRETCMCGIKGIVNFSATNAVDRHVVERMALAQAHRGPDDQGFFIEGNVGLGHRRLSIIDRSGGKQPIFNEDESIVVVFNGEIYN